MVMKIFFTLLLICAPIWLSAQDYCIEGEAPGMDGIDRKSVV